LSGEVLAIGTVKRSGRNYAIEHNSGRITPPSRQTLDRSK